MATPTRPPTTPSLTSAPARRSQQPLAHSGWLFPLVFVAGAAFMALEIVGSRVLAPYFGNSVFVWGSLIGVFLAALSLGYILGGRLSARRPSTALLGSILAVASVLVGLIVPFAAPIQEWVASLGLEARFNPLVAALLIFSPASVLMGMVSPFAVRLAMRDVASSGQTAGLLYGVSTIGSIVGTLAAAFWLIPTLGTELNIAWIAVAVALCAVTAATAGRSGVALVTSIVAGLFVATLLASAAGNGDQGTISADTYSPTWRKAGFRSDVKVLEDTQALEKVDSRYHRIAIADTVLSTENEVDDGMLRLMQFDSSRQAGAIVTGGEVDPLASSWEFRYINAMELLHAYRPNLERTLYIGLGSGQLAMRHHAMQPDAHIEAVEIDPEVVRLAEKWFEFDSEAIDVHTEDGRTWLQDDDQEWDAIVIDAYFADSIPFHLTTREFMETVEDRLAPGGIVAANIIGAPEGNASSLFRTMYSTYLDVFADIAVHPVPPTEVGDPRNFEPTAAGKPGATDFQNIALFASNASLAGYGTIVERAEGLATRHEIVSDRTVNYARYRYDAPIPLDDVKPLTDDFAPVDALLDLGY